MESMTGMTLRRAGTAVAALFVGLLAVVFGPAGRASAHAAFLQSDPQSGAVLAEAPSQVVLTFSEPVRIVAGRSRVFGPDGKPVDTGKPTTEGFRLHIPLKPTTAKGSYLISYRVISVDSHPISGGIPFSVGAPSANAPRPDTVATVRTDAVVNTLLGVSRYFGYAALCMVVGPALFLAVLWPRRLSRKGPLRLIQVGIGVLALSTLAEQYLEAPYHAGTTVFGASAADLRDVFNSQYGAAHLVRIGVIAALMVLLPLFVNRPATGDGNTAWTDRALVAILAVVGLATWPVSGHPAASSVPVLTTVADTAHLGAMAVWIGGLVTLFGWLLRRANARELGAILPVWSRWAMTAVIVLVVAGTAQALVTVGTVRGLYDTRYGQLLLLKIGLLALVIAAAWYSRRLVKRTVPDGETDDGSTRTKLRRTVLFELAGTATVIALAAALVQTTPARAALEESQRRTNSEYNATLSTSLYDLQVQVEPLTPGANTIHLFAFAPGGATIDVEEWKATAALPAKGVEPVEMPVLPVSGNHAVAQAQLSTPGTWQLRFTVRTTEIDAATVTAQVTVR
jgi:copper transport protein